MVVYILYSDTRSRYYSGQTADIEDRLIRHNQGREKSTKNGKPWRLVWHIQVVDRSEALKLEEKKRELPGDFWKTLTGNIEVLTLLKFRLKNL